MPEIGGLALTGAPRLEDDDETTGLIQIFVNVSTHSGYWGSLEGGQLLRAFGTRPAPATGKFANSVLSFHHHNFGS
ncbi:hypothetical protein FBY31_1718 [Arthrobacter sp. SLBN-100]|nr:hypothetical protein FBY31_1718 [Arthrobacter sp. SLBN-100]